jgi:lipid-A-disaccharide synthase
MKTRMKVFAGAGEASGDRILAALIAALKDRFPDLELRGFGGPLCEAQGLVSPHSLRDLAVNGVWDVARKALFLARVRAGLLRTLARERPDLVVLVDYPGMNVALARRALALGIPVHFVAPPQLWAYRDPARRLARLRAALSAGAGASLQVLFPFEAAAWEPWPRLRQGHFFEPPAFEPARGTRLLLCPGSRRAVLRRNLPAWLARVRSFFGTFEGVDVLVPEFLSGEAARLCASPSDGPGPRVLTDKEQAFAEAGAAVAFPGTVTLELFLRRIPTRAWAIVDPLPRAIAARRLRGPWLALPNVLAGREAVPEWAGTLAEFRANPPGFPARVEEWGGDPEGEIVGEVWARMGSPRGAAEGAAACEAVSPA